MSVQSIYSVHFTNETIHYFNTHSHVIEIVLGQHLIESTLAIMYWPVGTVWIKSFMFEFENGFKLIHRHFLSGYQGLTVLLTQFCHQIHGFSIFSWLPLSTPKLNEAQVDHTIHAIGWPQSVISQKSFPPWDRSPFIRFYWPVMQFVQMRHDNAFNCVNIEII